MKTYRGYKIKFYARSFDLRLYELSRSFYEELGYPCVRLTDQTADGYFYTMLRDTDCDIAINVDEDCFLADADALRTVVDAVIDGGLANAGCPDGGGNCPRHGNPVVTNPFFNVFNLKLIREKFSADAVRTYDYDADKARLMAEYPKERLETDYSFDNTKYVEPYYRFFLWLAGNFRTLYLASGFHADGITTQLYAPDGRLLCAHSWFARFYSTPTWIARSFQRAVGIQQDRINALIDEVYAMRGMKRRPETALATMRYTLDKMVRWSIKVPQRVAHWPQKLKKRLSGKDRWSL